MKYFFVTLLFSSLALASKYDYKTYWQDSGFIQTDKTSSFKLLIKKSPVVNSAPIATLTFTKKNQETKNEVVRLFKSSVGEVCKWRKESIDGLEIHECLAFRIGSLFRLAYNEKTNEFSTASIALRYLTPSYVEMHVLQFQGLTTNPTSSKVKKSALLMQALIQNAVAVELPPKVDEYIRNAGESFMGSVDRAADKVSSSFKETFSSSRVAKLSAISGASFGITSTISSMLTGFVVNGTYSMMRKLVYEVRGEFTPEEKKQRLERFDQAMQNFKNLETGLTELSSKLALASVELTLANGTSQEEFLARIDQDIELIRKSKVEANVDCADCAVQEKALKIKQLEDLKKTVALAGKNKNSQQLCENVEMLYKNWLNAEYTLLNSRRQVMQDLRVFNGMIINNVQTNTFFQENRKLSNACLGSAKEQLVKLKKELSGLTCVAGDLSDLNCQKFFAYKDMVESCQELEDQKPSEKDEVDLAVATGNLSKSLAQFSRELGSLSCDERTKGCQKGQLDRVRTEMKEAFVETAKQCPQYFFAKRTTNKSSTVVMDDSNSLFSLLKTSLPDAKATNHKAAEAVINWDYK